MNKGKIGHPLHWLGNMRSGKRHSAGQIDLVLRRELKLLVT